ncbi:hypothetical protein [Angustibacter luteus]|uniref:Sensor domain-containing protein n=1 Tax=Angustibacter luteus TaxID=658456 RepID=A0ABW1JH01_9ACTN
MFAQPSTSKLISLVAAIAVGVLVGLVALLLGGCGARTSDAGSPGTPGSTARSANALLVGADDLPAGFAASAGQASTYRQQVCGVDLEPTKPVQTASARFSQGPLGPFVEQRVRVYDDDSATDVLADLREALKTCGSYDLPASGSSAAVRVAVQPLDVPQLGDESVAWRQAPDTQLPITTDVVLIRSGRTVALVTSYALKQAPDAATATQAATAAADLLHG